jgi:3-oxoacid CoA-transferase subunit A
MAVECADAATALSDLLRDGITIAVGGFGLSGIPSDLIEAVRDAGVRDLTIVSNNMGVDGSGLGLLLETRQVRKAIASYVGENALFARLYLDGELDVELVPQGTLAERLRAGGAGIPAFYTPTGVGTPVADGKPHAKFNGRTYLLERAITADLALVHARAADHAGNLTYRYAARNFNPLVATCGTMCVTEAETILDDFLDPEYVITPGVFVDRMVLASPRVKQIEKRTVRPRQMAGKDA